MKKVFMNKYVKLLIDAVSAAAAFYLAFQIRFEGNIPAGDEARLWKMLLPVVAARLICLVGFGLWKQRWRFTTSEDALWIALNCVPPSLGLLLLRITVSEERWCVVPVGVIAADYLLAVTSALTLRFLWRAVCEHASGARPAEKPRRLLLIGAGYHGAMIASELAANKAISLVGFLDDDPGKAGTVIAGHKVLGPVGKLEECVKQHEVDDILVCVPPGERDEVKLKQLANGGAQRMKFMPTVDEVLHDEWSRVQSVKVDAVPRRPPVRSIESRQPALLLNKRILITGGAGFIGSSLASRLAGENELILFDLGFQGKPIEFTDLLHQPHIRLVEGDILNEQLLKSLCQDVDIVIHTAAVLGVSRVCNAARDTLETNYVGTARLLHALESNKRLERLIYFSTSEVFGVNSYQVKEDTPSSIGSSTEARWSYAIAKVAGEHLVRAYYRDAGTPVVIVRPFNVFGPRRTGDYALLRFILNAITGAPLTVHGDGSQIRAWCYIDDFCDAIMAMIEKRQAVGEDFNIGNPANTITVHELARKVVALADSSSPIAFIEHPFPDISIRVPCLTKAHQLLGYQPRFDLDTGLALTIDWYKENRDCFPELRNQRLQAVAMGAD
jgi:nucleoside-diphosphate-sugar epimerase